MNQITIACLMAESKGKPTYDENLIRHIVINNIRIINNKFKNEFGQMILCYDGYNSWRRSVFAQYKQNRKISRDASDFDWKRLFDFLTQLKNELEQNFPYKVLHLNEAEADDIIAVLAKNTTEKTIIISSDYDFIQLQKNPNIQQYSINLKKFISSEHPEYDLFTHVLRGDSSDGVPNFLSDDDTFLNENKRQKRLSQKRVNECFELYKADKDNWYQSLPNKDFYLRNKTLIDFDHIPESIQNDILNKYTSSTGVRGKVLDYFIKYDMKLLTSHLMEF